MNETLIDVGAFDRGTDPILQFFSLEQARGLVQFRGDASLRERIEELAAKVQ